MRFNKLNFLKKALVIVGILTVLLGISGLEEALSEMNYFSIVIAIVFIAFGIYLFIKGLTKEKLSEGEELLYIIYESRFKSILKEIEKFVRGSDLYSDLIARLTRIEENQNSIIEKLKE
jgi:uncharacterized membrane protein YiaA